MTDNEQKLRDALEALVIKLELAMPLLDNMAAFQANHGFPYIGPEFGEEMVNARKVLDEIQ